MTPKNIYVVTGSEDGVIAARTSAKAAVLDMLDYVYASELPENVADHIAANKRALRKAGFTQAEKRQPGIGLLTATVEHFIDQ